MSWALNLPVTRASGPSIVIHSTSHLEIEALEIALKRLKGRDKQRGRRPLVLGTVQKPLQGSDRTPNLVSFNGREGWHWKQENLNRLRRRRLILCNETRSGNKTNSSRFPPNMSRLNREGMKRTDPVTRSDGHKKNRLDGQTMKRSLVKRFERNSWQSPKNHREAAGRQQGLDASKRRTYTTW